MSTDHSDDGDPQALLEAAERRKRQAKRAAPDKPWVSPEIAALTPVKPSPVVAAVSVAVSADGEPETKRARKRVVAKRQPLSTDTLSDEAEAKRPRRAASLARPTFGSGAWARLGAWGFAACAAALAVLVMTLDALHEIPAPLPVGSIRISWLNGPQLPPSEVVGWLARFPARDRIKDPNPWVLDQLAEYLKQQPAVATVQQVRLVHEPSANGKGVKRTLELVLRLRQPVMPAILATGERAWVDAEGRVLPGTIPGPVIRRPLLRGVEAAKPGVVLSALAMWAALEPQLEQGLITDVVLNDALDERGARGIVLYTRQGSRLIWGDPAEERYGVKPDAKARDLAHTIRCQGDLGRIASINVRFSQPFFVFRE